MKTQAEYIVKRSIAYVFRISNANALARPSKIIERYFCNLQSEVT